MANTVKYYSLSDSLYYKTFRQNPLFLPDGEELIQSANS